MFVLVSKYKTRKLKARYSNVLFQIYVGSISFNDTLENSEASVIYFYRSNFASESIGKNSHEDQTFLSSFFNKNQTNLIKADNPIFPLKSLSRQTCILKIRA